MGTPPILIAQERKRNGNGFHLGTPVPPRFCERRRATPSAERRRATPGAERRRTTSSDERRQTTPSAERRRATPSAKHRRATPGNSGRRQARSDAARHQAPSDAGPRRATPLGFAWLRSVARLLGFSQLRSASAGFARLLAFAQTLGFAWLRSVAWLRLDARLLGFAWLRSVAWLRSDARLRLVTRFGGFSYDRATAAIGTLQQLLDRRRVILPSSTGGNAPRHVNAKP